MITSARRILGFAIIICSAAIADGALAHPHIWVTLKSELVYAPDGSATGVRHHLTFDDMYLAFALQDVMARKKGQFTREELSPLARDDVTSLKEFGYLTFAEADGKKIALKDPVDYHFDYDAKDAVLMLHFTVPFKAPVRTRELHVDVYDPEYFIEFSLAGDRTVASSARAPCPSCDPKMRPARAGNFRKRFSNSSVRRPIGGRGSPTKFTVKCP